MPNDIFDLAPRNDFRLLCVSQLSSYSGVSPRPMKAVQLNLDYLCMTLLRNMAAHFTKIQILGAYYPAQVAKMLGMPQDNPHSKGIAIDVFSPDISSTNLMDEIIDARMAYDGICVEGYTAGDIVNGHVHLELDRNNVEPLRARIMPPKSIHTKKDK